MERVPLSATTVFLALALVVTSLGAACSKKSDQEKEAQNVAEASDTVETEAIKPVAYWRDSKIKIPDCSDVARHIYPAAKTIINDVTNEELNSNCEEKFSAPYKICLLDSSSPDMRLFEHCVVLDCDLAFTRLEIFAMDAGVALDETSLERKRSEFVDACEALPMGTTKCLDQASNLEEYNSCEGTSGLELGWALADSEAAL